MTSVARSSIVHGFIRSYVFVPAYLLLIVALPPVLIVWIYTLAQVPVEQRVITAFAIPTCAVLSILIAGLLSRLTVRAIVAGKFPREMSHPIYGPRRLYALCWTSIYYCQPLYHVILAVPALKWLTFRLFGYKGSLDFQTYPDTWLRDLPLLTLGRGAYLSNKATISPNMCLRDGTIVILPIAIGPGTIIGHLTMVAPGASIGSACDIGVGASVGLKVMIGDRSTLGHCAQIDHQAVVGSNCTIGSRAYVGRAAIVHNGVRIPPGAVIPARTVLFTQADVAPYAVETRKTPITADQFRLEATVEMSAISA